MPMAKIDPELTIFYEDHWFGDPWRKPEVGLLVHGLAESSRAWFGWVPHLTRELRILRPDLRGFGRSTIPERGLTWSIRTFVEDLKRLLDSLEIEAVHIIGAKLGGSIAFQFAADHPDRTLTLSVLSGPVKVRNTGGSMDLLSIPIRIRQVGVRQWAAETQRARLGSKVPEEQVQWWTDMMAEADPQVCIDISSTLDQMAIFDNLHRIEAPTLIFTTDRSPLHSIETIREAQKKIPKSELLILPSDSYHVAAAQPDECAQHVLHFIMKQRAV
jgi:3-oxoadipate enol-lactonase